ncbi:hypothetical protein [Roseibacillus persicicus]|uniref:Uncharacterized protein n=1 Tax=Roseibacillus persicicus TaxID=454148 RepID=A0A918WP20_9BACT|nr:hypothetical protein [Roseibacillus persicicus]GHC62946.1 hypothetical protein GCM10007100_32870 [Roseibacillus persicicus]
MDDFPFQLVVVIVFIVIGVIRWFLENVLGRKPSQQQPEHWEEYNYDERADTVQPRSNSLEDLYEEARREILDRQNRNNPEPEVVQEKLNRTPPPLPPVPGKARINRPVPAQTSSQKAQSSFQATAQKSLKRTVLTDAQKKAASDFQQLGKKAKRATRQKSRVKEILSTPSSARDAIVLAEILGKPKGLR